MKRLTATTVLCLLLFSAAFVTGKGPSAAPEYPDSLRSVWLYTEGVKQNAIAGDSVRARELFLEAIRNDSTYAPAYYELAANGMYATPDEAVELARKAFRLDTTNKWYHQFYGQALIYAGRYDEALKVYRRLQTENPKDPDNYRILAALYEQKQSPVMALVTLDSAELRFGRIPVLSAMKRRLLVATNQIDKAVVEARAMVEAAPYEAQRHVVLGDLYAIAKKDSLARAEYDRALQIDSTNVQTLMALADFHAGRQDYRALLAVTRQLFQSDELPLETKIKRFGQFTSDTRFYREYYFQLNDLASTLAIRYPDDKRVVELYAGHLIASGELEQALALYKSHLADQPPAEEYFRGRPAPRLGRQIRHPRPGAVPREGRFPPLQRACDEQLEAVRQSHRRLQGGVAPCRHGFAAQRDLGHDRRRLASEGRGRRAEPGGTPAPANGSARQKGHCPQSHERVLQGL